MGVVGVSLYGCPARSGVRLRGFYFLVGLSAWCLAWSLACVGVGRGLGSCGCSPCLGPLPVRFCVCVALRRGCAAVFSAPSGVGACLGPFSLWLRRLVVLAVAPSCSSPPLPPPALWMFSSVHKRRSAGFFSPAVCPLVSQWSHPPLPPPRLSLPPLSPWRWHVPGYLES